MGAKKGVCDASRWRREKMNAGARGVENEYKRFNNSREKDMTGKGIWGQADMDIPIHIPPFEYSVPLDISLRFYVYTTCGMNR